MSYIIAVLPQKESDIKIIILSIIKKFKLSNDDKRLLIRNSIAYKEINIALEEGKMDEMLKKSNGKRTIPQIFFDDYHVGGFEELRALEKENKLLNLLK